MVGSTGSSHNLLEHHIYVDCFVHNWSSGKNEQITCVFDQVAIVEIDDIDENGETGNESD